MGSQYALTVKLDEKWRKQWSTVPEMKLCLAMDVSDGGDKAYHNIVACVKDIEANTLISWTDNYKIAGSVIENDQSGIFTGSTDLLSVQFGTKTRVAKAWTISAGPSSDAPTDGFLFTNEPECSALLYREIDGEFVPVYRSNAGNLPSDSSEIIVPKKKVYVWFTEDAKSASMVETMGRPEIIDFDIAGEKTATFSDAGVWTTS